MDIVKICKIHGPLKIHETYNKKNKIIYNYKICKYCTSISNKKNYYSNIDKKKKTRKKYYINNKIKCLKSTKIWRNNNKEKLKVYAKSYQLKIANNISDNYIKHIITRSSILKDKEIPEILIHVKRLHLKLKRKIKEINNVNK